MPVEESLQTAPLSGQLLAERTYDAIKIAILRSQLPPGTPLSVPELARQLKVSRSPVREAVQRLIHDGLAAHIPHRGAEVSRIDIDDLRQLYVVREQLEGLAARLATEKLDAESLTALREILRQHGAALDSDDATHIELDMRFHQLVRDIADNRHLSFVLDPIAGRSHFALHSLWRRPDARRLALDEHRGIVDAMASGDPAAAESAAQLHVSRLRIRLAQASARQVDPIRLRGNPLVHLAAVGPADGRAGRSAGDVES